MTHDAWMSEDSGDSDDESASAPSLVDSDDESASAQSQADSDDKSSIPALTDSSSDEDGQSSDEFDDDVSVLSDADLDRSDAEGGGSSSGSSSSSSGGPSPSRSEGSSSSSSAEEGSSSSSSGKEELSETWLEHRERVGPGHNCARFRYQKHYEEWSKWWTYSLGDGEIGSWLE